MPLLARRRLTLISVATLALFGLGALQTTRIAPAAVARTNPPDPGRARRLTRPRVPPKPSPPLPQPPTPARSRSVPVTVQVLPPPPTPVPLRFALEQNWPNPFQGTTHIVYSLPRPMRITLKVYTLLGQSVATLVRADQAPGRYAVSWDGTDDRGRPLGAGIYFYRMVAGPFTKSEKLVIER